MCAPARQAILILGLMTLGSVSLDAQQLMDVAVAESSSAAATAQADLPDAPGFEAQVSQTAPKEKVDPDGGPQQTKRIAGIMPNFRSVSAGTVLPPQTAGEKISIAAHDTFDYSSFIIVAIQAGISFNSKSYPEFHQGVMGYSRYYWHTFADTADENFMVGGLGPVLFHQDSRFYTLGHGGVVKRLTYAASRVVISRSNSGKPVFNFAEVVGAGAAAGLSSVYYPTVYRDWTKVGQKWLTSMIIDSANFAFKEYWPDINHKLFHSRKHNAAQMQ
ncbi:hypothetical protein SAMN05421771_0588 [Granulicella pectinivorans]|uniref:Uncharacterized protein n=2 Tax=Granulicella pectinivorans TaxID=474950 RepID=A0A1I6LDF5_9BACT|nr:hypothetical protein SAMN05421771_0588 [Granulicella pectinivorans]